MLTKVTEIDGVKVVRIDQPIFACDSLVLLRRISLDNLHGANVV
jgi:hypothetical protein